MKKSNYEKKLEAIYHDSYSKERLRIIDITRKTIKICQKDIKRYNNKINHQEQVIDILKTKLAELHPRRKS